MENQDRKNNILKAAIRIFGEKGYKAATTREIAEEAGVSVGTLFRSYGSKEELLFALPLEIVQNVMQKLLVESMETIFNEYVGKTPEETIRAFIKSRIKIINNNSEIFKVVITESLYDEELRAIAFKEVIYPMKNLIIKFIQSGMDNGYFRKVDPDMTATFFAGALILMNFECKFLNKTEDDKMTDTFIDLLFHGISSEKKG